MSPFLCLKRRFGDGTETPHYRRTFGDILIYLETPCFCDMEDKLSLLVSIPSHVLEQISLDNFIFFGKMLEFPMSVFPFSYHGGPWA